jgi:hypothetical protein
VRISFVSSVFSALVASFFTLVSLKFRIWFSSSVGSTFAVAGLFPLTESGLELLALKPPPPTFGVILLGLGAPGTQEASVYSV